MNDPRISKYREAAQAMQQGRFRVEVPFNGDDEVSQLGRALHELGHVLETRFEEMNRLSRITEEINAGLVLDEVLDHVFESFRPVIPYHRIGLALLEEDGRTVRARWARSDAPEIKINAGYSAPLQGSSLKSIIETGHPRILNDLEEYLRDRPRSDSTRLIVEEGMRSSLTCPLIALAKPIGFIFFSSMEPNTYRNVHIDLFLRIAGNLSIIVEKGRLYQQLVELNEVKNKFIGIVAHDLRNPLAALISYIGLIQNNMLGDKPGMQEEVMGRMGKTCDTMMAMINDLLDVSAIESGQLKLSRETVDLADYLADCCETQRLIASSKSIALELDLPDDLPSLLLDPHRINQVLANLISNAVKFSYPDSTITVSATRKGNVVEIAIADQGQGIPHDEIPAIFSDFGRASIRPTAGETSTGLGLAIVKRIVKAHNGQIWVKSKEGEGSTFTFALPVEEKQ